MPMAARMGDKTAHSAPLAGVGPGAPTVLIGGMPAWRVGDVSNCPLSTGPVPHVGGSVVVGSVTVLISGQPAARMGDQIVEAGPPNTIVQGCTTVMIG
jgi:uncharacterized Zn-binding protein involved in type VI secretion